MELEKFFELVNETRLEELFGRYQSLESFINNLLKYYFKVVLIKNNYVVCNLFLQVSHNNGMFLL